MIKALYEVSEDRIISLDVSGHAEYGEYGKDLICASVSCIMFGLMNAIDAAEKDVTIQQEENRIIIEDHSGCQVIQDYLQLAITQMKTIEVSYGDFISVERK